MYTPRYRRWKKGGKEVSILQFFSTAITSISKSTFKGKEATPTQDLAGLWVWKCLAYTELNSAKFFMSAKNTLTLTILSKEELLSAKIFLRLVIWSIRDLTRHVHKIVGLHSLGVRGGSGWGQLGADRGQCCYTPPQDWSCSQNGIS